MGSAPSPSTVSIDCASAARLIAEGAICVDADARMAMSEEKPVRLRDDALDPFRPVLVCHSSPRVVAMDARQLAGCGIAVWQVVDECGKQGCSPCRCRRH